MIPLIVSLVNSPSKDMPRSTWSMAGVGALLCTLLCTVVGAKQAIRLGRAFRSMMFTGNIISQVNCERELQTHSRVSIMRALWQPGRRILLTKRSQHLHQPTWQGRDMSRYSSAPCISCVLITYAKTLPNDMCSDTSKVCMCACLLPCSVSSTIFSCLS